MKTRLILVVVLLFFIRGFSQTQEIPFQIESNKTDFTLIAEKTPTLYKFTLQKKDVSKKKEFSMQVLSLDNFIYLFKGNILDLESNLDEYVITQKAIELYSIMVNNNEKGPLAGKLKVSKKINVYNEDEKNRKIGELEISSVSCVIQQGFIQDIKVEGVYFNFKKSEIGENPLAEISEKNSISFTNRFGIGFTSKKNYVDLSYIKLFVSINFGKDSIEEIPSSLSNIQKVVGLDLKNTFINLGDVIKFDRKPDLYTNDFSPADIAGNWKSGEEIPLYKEPTFKLFEGRIFSDFAGFNSDSPNGLIQIEVEKKANLSTQRYTLLKLNFLRSGIGFFEYIKPYGGYSKFEENNKNLVPYTKYKDTTIASSSTKYSTIDILSKSTTPIDLLKHQTWRLGNDINFCTIDMPLLKSQLFIDGGVSYASSAIRDSIKSYIDPKLTGAALYDITNAKLTTGKAYTINYWQFYPKFSWKYSAEYRYGIDLSYSPKYFYMTSDKLDLIGIENKSNEMAIPRNDISKWINEFEFLGYWRIDTNGKLFFRWRLNYEMGYSSNYYNQIQLGYAFNILGNK